MTAMVDTRFHSSSGPISLGVVLSTLGRQIDVDEKRAAGLVIQGAEELPLAGPNHLALAAHAEYREALADTGAGAVVVHPRFVSDVPRGAVAIVDERPHELFVDLLERLYPLGTRGIERLIRSRVTVEHDDRALHPFRRETFAPVGTLDNAHRCRLRRCLGFLCLCRRGEQSRRDECGSRSRSRR